MLRFGEDDPFTQIVKEETADTYGNATAATNRRVRDRLAALAAHGEEWAATILDQCELSGIGTEISRSQKRDRTAIYLPLLKRKVELPSMYGTRKRNPKTGKRTNEWQRSKWKQESLDIAMEVSYDLIREGGRQVERGEAIAALVGFIRKLCPEATSVIHGCELLGLDAERLDLGFDEADADGTYD